MLRILFLKMSHHLSQLHRILVQRCISKNRIVYAKILKPLINLIADNIPKFLVITELKTNNLVLTGNSTQSLLRTLIGDKRQIILILSNQRNQGHQVRLTGTIVTDNLQSESIKSAEQILLERSIGLSIIKVLTNPRDDSLLIILGENEIPHKRLTIILLFKTRKFYNLINRLKLNQLFVLHNSIIK